MPIIPSWASLLTSTTRASTSRVLPRLLFRTTTIPPRPLSVLQHRRSFVKVLVKELSIRSIIIGGRNPFPWHNAWESYAYAGSAVDPARCRPPSELLAEVGCEVVAVLGQKVVGRALEFLRSLRTLAAAFPSHTNTKGCPTSCIIASSSSVGRNEKPWRIDCLNVPPGGSCPGFVQYTPVKPRRSWPPYAYSLSPITTPECSNELPIAQSTVATLPGGSRS